MVWIINPDSSLICCGAESCLRRAIGSGHFTFNFSYSLNNTMVVQSIITFWEWIFITNHKNSVLGNQLQYCWSEFLHVARYIHSPKLTAIGNNAVTNDFLCCTLKFKSKNHLDLNIIKATKVSSIRITPFSHEVMIKHDGPLNIAYDLTNMKLHSFEVQFHSLIFVFTNQS